MRRVLASATALLFLTAAWGCHHTAGVCDCGYDGVGCCGGPPPHVIRAEPVRAEPIKVMPKAGGEKPASPEPGK